MSTKGEICNLFEFHIKLKIWKFIDHKFKIKEMYKIPNIYEIHFQITLDFDIMPVEPIPRSIALSKTALQNYVHLTGIDVEEGGG